MAVLGYNVNNFFMGKNLIIALTTICLFAGCGNKPDQPLEESQEQKTDRWHDEAQKEMLKEATNQVSGISRIIFADVENRYDAPVKWYGRITLDYINHVGGIDRTNLYFKIGFAGGPYVLEDYERQYHEAVTK